MINMTCQNKDRHISKDGKCCEQCPAGKYVQTDCTDEDRTKCGDCPRGHYTATTNYLPKCQVCSQCSPSNNHKKVADCTADRNTVCGCVTGYYCSTEECDHCQPVTHCFLGEGVKVQATRTNNTICAPCEKGTYSNVTDFLSPCKAHTRCEDYGRELETPGTLTTDAVCGNFISHCPWMLPAGLWSGFVLTVLVVAAVFLFWKAKHRSYKPANRCGPDTPLEIVPIPPITPPPELSSHCQESCSTDDCKLPLFGPDDPLVICSIQDSFDCSLPITLLKGTVSFAESNHTSGTGILRSYSEPQEDEWCGTEQPTAFH